MAAGQLQKIRSDIAKKLHEPGGVADVLAKVEEKSGIDRIYIVAGICGFFALYLILGYFAELVCNTIGFLYPAYMSIKAIESPSKEDDTQWLTYWVVFALFNVVEFAADVVVGWFPIYWLCKCVLMLYLHLPITMGAQKLYLYYVRPFMMKYQPIIDRYMEKYMYSRTNEVTAKIDEVNAHSD